MRWEYYDWLPVTLLALTIFFTWLSCWKVEYLKDDTGDGILDFYTRLSNKYVRFSIFFLGAFYFVTLLSVLSTIIVIYLTAFVESRSGEKIFLYSVISLFCTILNFVINLRDISTTYRAYFIKFEGEILRIRDFRDHCSSDCPLYQKLHEINREAEEMLKNVIR